MRGITLAWCLFALAGVSTSSELAPPETNAVEQAQEPAPDPKFRLDPADKYIVSLKRDVDVPAHMAFVREVHGGDSATSGILDEFDFAGYRCYYGHFNSTAINAIGKEQNVAFVEKDEMWTATRMITQFNSRNYGLGLISHRKLINPGLYEYDDSAGAGTYAYILDSGINSKHVDFDGRAKLAYQSIPVTGPQDNTGHGTMMAGIVASRTFGVAKKASVMMIKCTEDDNSLTGIVAKGLDWAVKDIIRRRRQASAVILMPLEGPISRAMNTAIGEAYGKGITIVAGAGNKGQDAAGFSPGSAAGAFTIAATDQRRAVLPRSNFGSRVAMFAPGLGIPTTTRGGPRAVSKVSGTSAAAAHVAGLVLYFKKLQPAKARSPAALMQYMTSIATTQAVGGQLNGTPNKFAYNGSGK